MMGPRQEAQAALFYEFSLEEHVPQDVNGGVKTFHWGGAKVGQLDASALERTALK